MITYIRGAGDGSCVINKKLQLTKVDLPLLYHMYRKTVDRLYTADYLNIKYMRRLFEVMKLFITFSLNSLISVI